MEKWEEIAQNEPLKEFCNFSDEYNYVACFDENGAANAIFQMFEVVMGKKPLDENRRYFTLTCCLFSKEEYEFSKELITKLKKQYFKKSEKPVVLHTRDIVKKLGPFNFGTKEKYSNFLNSLSNMLSLIKCKIISVTFDLYSYVLQNYKYDPYEVAFDIILQCLYKNVPRNQRIALVFESRGKNEDRNLYKHIYKIINITGCKHVKKEIIQCYFKEAFFNHKVSKDGSTAYPGIEIADLCSYPIYRYMRFGTIGKDFNEIKDKVVTNKKGEMVGIRNFPSKWIKK